ncbi:MAG: hypothetical protein LUC41_02855 [Clostridiales bacterium]|nr:hypothetical protein [Clostridiales bacterium]
MKETCRKETLSFGAEIELKVTQVGGDIHLLLTGGGRPHIGCTVMSVPRPSLTGDGSNGCTSSVINALGHKDEEICRLISEKVCRRSGCLVVCSGGFHVDGISAEQIKEVVDTVGRMILPVEATV